MKQKKLISLLIAIAMVISMVPTLAVQITAADGAAVWSLDLTDTNIELKGGSYAEVVDNGGGQNLSPYGVSSESGSGAGFTIDGDVLTFHYNTGSRWFRIFGAAGDVSGNSTWTPEFGFNGEVGKTYVLSAEMRTVYADTTAKMGMATGLANGDKPSSNPAIPLDGDWTEHTVEFTYVEGYVLWMTARNGDGTEGAAQFRNIKILESGNCENCGSPDCDGTCISNDTFDMTREADFAKMNNSNDSVIILNSGSSVKDDDAKTIAFTALTGTSQGVRVKAGELLNVKPQHRYAFSGEFETTPAVGVRMRGKDSGHLGNIDFSGTTFRQVFSGAEVQSHIDAVILDSDGEPINYTYSFGPKTASSAAPTDMLVKGFKVTEYCLPSCPDHGNCFPDVTDPPLPGEGLKVALMARDNVSWATSKGAIKTINGNGTYEVELALTGGALTNLGVFQDGMAADFDGPGTATTVAGYANATVTIDSVTIGGAAATFTAPADDKLLASNGTIAGLARIQLWNAWSPADQLLTGTTEPASETGGDALVVTTPATVKVTFTVSGADVVDPPIPPDPPNPGGPNEIKMAVMARDNSAWATNIGTTTSVKGNGTYTAELNVTAGPLVNLGVFQENIGADFNTPGSALTIPGYENATFTIDSVEIGGSPANIAEPTDDALLAPDGGLAGLARIQLWNAWSVGDQLLTGYETVQATAEGGEAMVITTPVTVKVTFTVSGYNEGAGPITGAYNINVKGGVVVDAETTSGQMRKNVTVSGTPWLVRFDFNIPGFTCNGDHVTPCMDAVVTHEGPGYNGPEGMINNSAFWSEIPFCYGERQSIFVALKGYSAPLGLGAFIPELDPAIEGTVSITIWDVNGEKILGNGDVPTCECGYKCCPICEGTTLCSNLGRQGDTVSAPLCVKCHVPACATNGIPCGYKHCLDCQDAGLAKNSCNDLDCTVCHPPLSAADYFEVTIKGNQGIVGDDTVDQNVHDVQNKRVDTEQVPAKVKFVFSDITGFNCDGTCGQGCMAVVVNYSPGWTQETFCILDQQEYVVELAPFNPESFYMHLGAFFAAGGTADIPASATGKVKMYVYDENDTLIKVLSAAGLPCGGCGFIHCPDCQGPNQCPDLNCTLCWPQRCPSCNGERTHRRDGATKWKAAPPIATAAGVCTCYILGDLNNNATIEVGDAVQILMHLAKNPTSQVATDARAKKASLITVPNSANPVVADAVQVLMNLAKNPTSIVNGSINGNR